MKPAALLGMLVLPGSALAQEAEALAATEGPVIFFSGPQFFAALFVGVALAVAFQFVLTNLSIAAGISALGPDESRGGRAGSREGQPDVMTTLRRVTAGYGLWTLLTASLALFFASWLGVEISMTGSAMIGAILGLTIWAIFYVTMTVLEIGAITSLVGSMVRTAASGLRSMKEAAGSLLQSGPERKAADTAASVAAAVRDEIFGDLDATDLQRQLRSFLRELKPGTIEPKDIRKELEQLFDQTEIRAMIEGDDRVSGARLRAAFETKYGSPERRRAALDRAKEAVSTVKEEAQSDKPLADRVAEAGLRLAGKSREESEAILQEWEAFLRSTGKQELDPDRIKREIETLVRDPKAGVALLKSRAREAFSKSTVAAVLAERADMSREEAERTADRAEQIIREFRQQGRQVQERVDEIRERAIGRVRDYLNALEVPALRYEGLRDDFLRLLQDPAAGADALLRRFQSIDRETVKSLLASRADLSPDDLQQILGQFESARDLAVAKAQQLKREVERRMDQLKEEALKQAEEARQAAATAAWWAGVTAVGSGIAAVAGGLVAVL